MPTFTINGNIRTDTEANWTADATVYSAKTMLVSTDVQWTGTDQNKFKLANGTDTWANLDYVPFTPNAITASSSDTLTNKTFDANGTGNSLSNVDVADLANGTDGELITWDAAGAPTTVAVGTSGQVLTSNGAGAAPTFQAAPTGESNYTLLWSCASFNPADSVTYYFAAIQGQVASTASSAWQRHLMPVAASSFTLNIGYLRTNSASSENVTITLNNHTQATSANFTTAWNMGTLAPQLYTATLSCNASDEVSISIDTPAWTTNPLSVRVYMVLNFADGV